MISILTASYNRADCLLRLYESLKTQNKHTFEWVIIDDGSEDNTQKLVKRWQEEESLFCIRYYRQNNGGKHRAINRGIKYVNYDYVYIIDSDDIMLPNAVELIEKWITEIGIRKQYAAVAGTRVDRNGNIIGEFPDDQEFVDASERERKKKKLRGDKAEVFKVDILRKYPFPEFLGENFISECAVWDKLALDGYCIRWYKEPLCICEYQRDGLTLKKDKEIENFQGYTFVTYQQLKLKGLKGKLGLIFQYQQVAKKAAVSNFQICENLNIHIALLYLAQIMGYFYWKINKIKR